MENSVMLTLSMCMWLCIQYNIDVQSHMYLFARDSLQYSFMALLQEELDTVVKEWNSHRIRQSAHADTPGGVPDILYFMPELSGTKLNSLFIK